MVLTGPGLRAAARRRLPRFVFDFIDGGAGDEGGIRRNRAALDAATLLPRALTGIDAPDLGVTLFGETYAAPFAVAPMGLANLVGPGTDAALARAAAAAGIPYALSTAATTSMETLAPVAGRSLWLQLYIGRDPAITEHLIGRAEALGITTLIVTVDTPVPGRRPRDVANGFSFPPRPRPRLLLDMALRPRWALTMARGGVPGFRNLAPSAPAGGGSLIEMMRAQSSATTDWDTIAALRRRWKGALVVKGLLDPDDVVRAAGLGVDGVVVSNHGGRQLASLPAAITMLPAIRAAVGPEFPLLADGGVTSGEDVARLLAAGATMALVGKAMLYAAALGPGGPVKLVAGMRDDLLGATIQLGIHDWREYPSGG
ncbi:alpha-hydroxy acid oxidase [Sphingomonas naphthae]|uniref:Alpha-hydroxy acid oxidase n=1 Tax=Sphingomonas naphthae TaxID=1813468 RepID=A0ABY7TMA8_9SPHN|nr:alpha-hydroxy acid oxidase [Sphingomonas naphthae]WCT74356.1 alpha-hydroxy acid oxidase [Sphingomonas naphthae]